MRRISVYSWCALGALLAAAPPAAGQLMEGYGVGPGIGGGLGLGFAGYGQAQRSSGAARAEAAYNRAMRSLDQRKYDEAVAQFKNVAEEGAARADAALYWMAYSQNKLGRRDEALATLESLKQKYASSRWLNDAKVLEAEVRQASGQPVSPDSAADDDMKLMAINSLMNTDSERALPILEKILSGSQRPKVKERALFVLSQSNSPKAREILLQVARGGNLDLQRMAIRNLGVFGGKDNRQVLADLYQSQTDSSVRREILRSFMTSGDRERLGMAAKSEKDPTLRSEAIRLLGAMGDQKTLSEMYASESDPQIRMEILSGLMICGGASQIIEAASNEKDQAVRQKAIQLLGVMGSSKTGEALVQLYGKETAPELKKRIIQALFTQGNAKTLVEIAKKESDPELKREAVRALSLMHSKEATDYMMELLNK
jgi:HEAT repeat protein